MGGELKPGSHYVKVVLFLFVAVKLFCSDKQGIPMLLKRQKPRKSEDMNINVILVLGLFETNSLEGIFVHDSDISISRL